MTDKTAANALGGHTPDRGDAKRTRAIRSRRHDDNEIEFFTIARGDGPPFVKIGRSVRYGEGALREWLQGQTRRSTSEPR